MSITINSLMQQRRDTAADWTSENPTLLNGELGYETDTGKWKVGTGSAAWTALGYTPWSQISAYPLVNANIASNAEIAVSKLGNGTARQLLQTDAGGTGVEFASNMSSVAIQDWRVSVADLSGVVEDNDLSGEVLSSAGGLVLGVGGDVSSLDVLDGDILNVEANVVAGNGLGQRFVVHLD